jgi:hypothetical protein
MREGDKGTKGLMDREKMFGELRHEKKFHVDFKRVFTVVFNSICIRWI